MTRHFKALQQEANADELQLLALEEIVRRRRYITAPACLVMAAGKSRLPAEMARLGAAVLAADQVDQAGEIIGRALSAGFKDEITFYETGFDPLPDALPGQPFDLIFCRRGLSSLPRDQACQTLRRLLGKLKIGGKLYLSLLGKHSELSYRYSDSENPVAQRFAPLHPAIAEKYHIDQPVCLYSERELFFLLMEAGGSVLRTFTSTHGNVKGVAVRV